MTESITGVALHAADGRVLAMPKPFRHHHLFALAALMGVPKMDDPVQGFMTSEGRFVGRTEAKIIVAKSGQDYTVSFAGEDPKLYSEDVW